MVLIFEIPAEEHKFVVRKAENTLHL